MPLILAVEPDAGRASRLRATIEHHLDVTLVLHSSADQALAALEGRIPDLLLMPPLVRPQDEAALNGFLHAHGTAVAHVQTLTVPLLADVEQAGPGGGAPFRRERPGRPTREGCDPAVFAEQLATYLMTAEQRRSFERDIASVGEGSLDDAAATVTFPPEQQSDDAAIDAGFDEALKALEAPPEPEPGPAAAPEPLPKPNEEEWRVFDPARGRFPALLAHLDRIVSGEP